MVGISGEQVCCPDAEDRRRLITVSIEMALTVVIRLCFITRPKENLIIQDLDEIAKRRSGVKLHFPFV
jgi:hypothetical protein